MEAENKTYEWNVPDIKTLPEYPTVKEFTDPNATTVESSHDVEPLKIVKSEKVVEIEKEKIHLHQPTKEEQIAWTVGDIAFRYSRKAGRINMEHQRTLETVSIRISNDFSISGDQEFREETTEPRVFTCSMWQIQWDLRDVQQSGFITLRFTDTLMEIRLPIAVPFYSTP
jgi:hypothetical protein